MTIKTVTVQLVWKTGVGEEFWLKPELISVEEH